MTDPDKGKSFGVRSTHLTVLLIAVKCVDLTPKATPVRGLPRCKGHEDGVVSYLHKASVLTF